MTVHAPRREYSLRKAILARTTDVIHDLVRPPLRDRPANAPGQIIKRFVPRDAHPLALAATPRPLQRIKDKIRVRDLVERRRAFGAVAPARARMLWIALELLNLQALLIDVGQQ